MAAAQALALAPGTRLSEYEVRSVLGSGGFGIVYLAWDHGLQREVAIKEYMPATLAGRGPDLSVSVRSDATATTFALGLKSFVNEARLLAQFNHPSLVKVHRFWEAHNTAYMVMPYYRGRTLRHVRVSMSEAPGDVACRHVLRALMSALDVLHRDDVFHRDIAPDNILLCDDSTPVLLDFGAARKVIGEGNQALTSILKPHYAPLEQYADQRSMRQGPWTDVYALGATLYFFVTGEEPIAAASRAVHDDQPRLSEQAEQGAIELSPLVASIIDWMLALKPMHRPQSVQAVRDALEGHTTVPAVPAAPEGGYAPVGATAPGMASPRTTAPATPVTKPHRTDIDPTQPDAQAPSPASATMLITGNPALQAAAPRTNAPAANSAPGDRLLSPTIINTASHSASIPPVALAVPPRRNGAILLGLLALNVLAWWWFTRPAPPPSSATVAAAAQAAASSAAPALAASTPAGTEQVTAPAMPVVAEPKETIVSVMPGRATSADIPPPAASASRALNKTEQIVTYGSAALPPITDTVPRTRPERPVPPVAAEPAKSKDPRERCGDRMFIAMSMCIRRECNQDASLRNHPECVKMREIEEAQRNPTY
jgi:serine/threonine protein kinase